MPARGLGVMMRGRSSRASGTTETDSGRHTPGAVGPGLLRSFGVISVGRVGASICQAAAVLIVARQLSLAEFGVFATVLAMLQVLQALADFGAGTAVSRHHQDHETVGQIFRFGRILSVAAGVIALGGLVLVYFMSGNDIVIQCIGLALWVPFERRAEVRTAFLIAKGDSGFAALWLLLRRIAVLGVTILALASGAPVVVMFAVSSAIASATAAGVLDRRARPGIRRRESRAEVNYIPRTAELLYPYWLNGIAQQLRLLDMPLLTAVAGASLAAPFAPASRLIAPFRLLPTTWAQVLLARLAAGHKLRVGADIALPTFASGVVFGLLGSFSPTWLPALMGQSYIEAVAPLQAILAGLVVATLASLLTAVAQARDHAKGVAAVSLSTGVATLFMVAIFGATLGPLGAATATIIGFSFQVMALIVLLIGQKRHGGAIDD